MNCSGCANSVTQALRGVPGVANAEVSLQEGRARVVWDDGVGITDRLIAAVKEAGFEAEVGIGRQRHLIHFRASISN